MKNVLFVLSLLVSGFVSSQNHNDTLQKWYLTNKLAVEKEFTRLIDSARSTLILEKRVIYRSVDGVSQKELKSILKKETSNGNFCDVNKYPKSNKIRTIVVTKNFPVVKMKYDSLLSLAAEHHAKYLTNVGDKHVSHEEYPNLTSNFLILEKPKDRVNHFCVNRIFVGECLATYKCNVKLDISLPDELNGLSVESFAYHFFKRFKGSKPHWSIFMMKEDVDFIGCSLDIDFNNNFLSFVVVIGNDINHHKTLFVEGLSLK